MAFLRPMPKVLRIINRFNLGGITYNTGYLTRHLPPDFDSILIGGSPLPNEAHSGFILDKIGVPYRELSSMNRSVNALNDWTAYHEIKQIIRDFKPDIVHTHAAKAGALGRMAASALHVPIVVHTFHGLVFDGYFSPWKSKIVQSTERFLARKSDAIVAISELQKNDIVNRFHIAPDNKVHVIPLGFDLKRFTEKKHERREAFRKQYLIEDDEIAIGIIGRMVPIKNHELFIEIIKQVAASSSQKVRAFIIGDGETKAHIQQLCAPLSFSEGFGQNADVYFTSWIKDLEEVLPAMDIIAMTSHNEGTPVSLIEAQAAGVPVVSTDVGGVRNCILENQSGFVVSPGYSETFTRAIIRLIENPELRKQMGTAGHDFVIEKYHYMRLVSDMERLYRGLLCNIK